MNNEKYYPRSGDDTSSSLLDIKSRRYRICTLALSLIIILTWKIFFVKCKMKTHFIDSYLNAKESLTLFKLVSIFSASINIEIDFDESRFPLNSNFYFNPAFFQENFGALDLHLYKYLSLRFSRYDILWRIVLSQMDAISCYV
jgi:hypothetical protein